MSGERPTQVKEYLGERVSYSDSAGDPPDIRPVALHSLLRRAERRSEEHAARSAGNLWTRLRLLTGGYGALREPPMVTWKRRLNATGVPTSAAGESRSLPGVMRPHYTPKLMQRTARCETPTKCFADAGRNQSNG
jgi:hypothetical protein